MPDFDVIIIGAGICGCAIAYELSRYTARVLLLEKENDVALGSTKANSGIVHGGYDPMEGTLMARYNLRGNRLIKKLCSELDVPYRHTGSLVLAFTQEEIGTLHMLYERGIANGVQGLSLLSGQQAREKEPNLSHEVTGALYCREAGVVSPWELAIALAEIAVQNGVSLRLNSAVQSVEGGNGCSFTVKTDIEVFTASYIINAAGINSGVLAAFGGGTFAIKPSKGEYYLLDKTQGRLTSTVLFMCPTAKGKGVLIAPTAHGNIIIGPNAESCDFGDTSTSGEGLFEVRQNAAKIIPSVQFKDNIQNFAGIRAASTERDFIVGESPACKGFYNIAGIKSPGLTAAPAIAEDVTRMLLDSSLPAALKTNWNGYRKVVRFADLSDTERAAITARNPSYGHIVCRCETVTEGEVLACLSSPIPPVSVDGVKRRCRCGSGRCQGGFCGPKIHRILAEHYGVDMTAIPKDKTGSFILTGPTKAMREDGR